MIKIKLPVKANLVYINQLAEKAQKHDLLKEEKLFGQLFFNGGRIPYNAKKLSKQTKLRLIRLFKQIATSWEPRHEVKESACALLLGILCGKIQLQIEPNNAPTLTMDKVFEAADMRLGFCTNCMEFTTSDVEPSNAISKKCDTCGKFNVCGADYAYKAGYFVET